MTMFPYHDVAKMLWVSSVGSVLDVTASLDLKGPSFSSIYPHPITQTLDKITQKPQYPTGSVPKELLVTK